MNLRRCRSCGLKLETGGICQRCQDIDELARDVFGKPLSLSFHEKLINVSQLALARQDSFAISYALRELEAYQDNLSFSGIETDPIELAQLRGASFYPRQWSKVFNIEV